MNQTPAEYFQHLTKVLEATEVTGSNGEVWDIAKGTKQAIDWLVDLSQSKGVCKTMIIGNGGSAAIASHIQNDLSKAVGIRALIFNEASLLTALTNDDGYEVAFQKLVELWGNEGDLLIAISSSGKSQNILNAVEAARKKRVRVLTFSGFAYDNPLKKLGDINFYVQDTSYGFVEVAHMALGHYLSDSAMQKVRK